MNDVVAAARERFGLEWDHRVRPDLVQVGVASDRLIGLLEWLKAETGFVQLTLLSVVDWIEDDEFQLTYILTEPAARAALMVCSRIDRATATARSVSRLWPQAVTYEQEINEMYGIHFEGSPRQGVPFILEGWRDLPPMRRDFDTVKYARENYSERPGRESVKTREHMRKRSGERGYSNE